MFGRTIRSLGGVRQRMASRSLQQQQQQQQQRWASVLVLAEHNNKELNPATHSLVTAAQQLGEAATVLVLGEGCAGVAAQAAKVTGVSAVLHCDDAALAHGSPENATQLLQALVSDKGFSHILFPNSAWGKDVMPRLAVKLDTQPISDVIEIKAEDTFVRPVYAGKANMTVKTEQPLKILSIRPTSFDKAAEGGSATMESVAGMGEATASSEWIKDDVSEGSGRPELGSASVVVSGGRGLKSKENFSLMEQLADNLGGAIGASRAAVDAGYAGNELQVGQTGKVVAPDLYIAVGISGAVQHLAGMKDSKTIVSINKDEEAPIFQISDYGLKADLFSAVPEMIEKTKK